MSRKIERATQLYHSIGEICDNELVSDIMSALVMAMAEVLTSAAAGDHDMESAFKLVDSQLRRYVSMKEESGDVAQGSVCQ